MLLRPKPVRHHRRTTRLVSELCRFAPGFRKTGTRGLHLSCLHRLKSVSLCLCQRLYVAYMQGASKANSLSFKNPVLIMHARYRARQPPRARRRGSAAPRRRSHSPRPTAASAPCWTAGLRRGRRRSCPSSRPRPTSASWHFDCPGSGSADLGVSWPEAGGLPCTWRCN